MKKENQIDAIILKNSMAKADTYKMERGGFLFLNKCDKCNNKPLYRAFYYPTVMNGDAEWLGDFCEEHKDVEMTTLTPKE